MTSPLLIERRGDTTLLTLNRPERRNALSPRLLEALLEALRAPGPRPGAFVLTGAGVGFCAGGDLGASDRAGGGADDGEDGFFEQHRGRAAFAALLGALANSPVPVIAAVNGDALGGGCGLAAACHLIVADERARFGTPELKLGLFPWMISPVLSRNLPRKIVMDMVLTGRRLSAIEARDLGLVNRVSAPGEALAGALALAEAVTAWSPAVVSMGLSALAAVEDLPLGPALAHMHSQLSLNLMLEDAAEGIGAFLGRRPPEWKGR